MTRQKIALKRCGHSDFETSPLGELAEAVMDGVDGVVNARVDRMEQGLGVAVVSFGWIGTGQPKIPDWILDLFGLCRVE